MTVVEFFVPFKQTRLLFICLSLNFGCSSKIHEYLMQNRNFREFFDRITKISLAHCFKWLVASAVCGFADMC